MTGFLFPVFESRDADNNAKEKAEKLGDVVNTYYEE